MSGLFLIQSARVSDCVCIGDYLIWVCGFVSSKRMENMNVQ